MPAVFPATMHRLSHGANSARHQHLDSLERLRCLHHGPSQGLAPLVLVSGFRSSPHTGPNFPYTAVQHTMLAAPDQNSVTYASATRLHVERYSTLPSHDAYISEYGVRVVRTFSRDAIRVTQDQRVYGCHDCMRDLSLFFLIYPWTEKLPMIYQRGFGLIEALPDRRYASSEKPSFRLDQLLPFTLVPLSSTCSSPLTCRAA